jgi:glycosyltransferase involved in cell wall biosynthesis
MSKFIFYTHEKNKDDIAAIGYYAQDIEALKAIGHEVVVVNKLNEIPLDGDIIFIWWWTRALLPAIIYRLMGKRVVITGTFNFKHPESYQGRDYFSRPLYQRFAIWCALKLASLNIFVNKQEYGLCVDYFGMSNAIFIPHVLENKYIQGPGSSRLLAIFNISWSGIYNLQRKGVFDLVRAFSIVSPEFPDLKLYLAGLEGDGYPLLQQLCTDMGVLDQVVLLGRIDEKKKIELLRSVEIYVQPSYFEGFGLAIAEAMGCGSCVVSCPVGGVPFVVGDAGVFVEPGDIAGIANAIRLLISDKLVRDKYSRSAHNRVVEHYSFDRKISEFSRIFNESEK